MSKYQIGERVKNKHLGVGIVVNYIKAMNMYQVIFEPKDKKSKPAPTYCMESEIEKI